MADKKIKIQQEKPEEKIQALNRAKRLCSSQEKCTSDILKKLQDWNINPEFHDFIIKELKENGFISETRYAIAFANDKYKFARWGKLKIAYTLKGKKIPETIIKEALNSIDDSSYILLIEKEIKNKLRATKETDKYKLKAKLYRFSQAKGFESELSLKIIDKLIVE